MLKNVPNIKKYLLQSNNKTGWLPICRVLNTFQILEWKTEKTIKKHLLAQKLLQALIEVDYDFLKKSRYKLDRSDYLSTLECMMTSIVDI